MKTTIVLLATFALSLTMVSCKKDTPATADTATNFVYLNNKIDSITATVNGIHYVFNETPWFNSSRQNTSKTFFSAASFGIDSNQILLSLSTGIPGLLTGDYTSELNCGGLEAVIAFKMADSSFWYVTTQNEIVLHPATATITSCTDDAVGGTFEGRLYPSTDGNIQAADTTLTPVQITDGKFYVHR